MGPVSRSQTGYSSTPIPWKAPPFVKKDDGYLDCCVACDSPIESIQTNYPYEVQDAMRVYCLTCAKEVLGIAIPFVGTLQADTGGGRRVIKESKTH